MLNGFRCNITTCSSRARAGARIKEIRSFPDWVTGTNRYSIRTSLRTKNKMTGEMWNFRFRSLSEFTLFRSILTQLNPEDDPTSDGITMLSSFLYGLSQV